MRVTITNNNNEKIVFTSVEFDRIRYNTGRYTDTVKWIFLNTKLSRLEIESFLSSGWRTHIEHGV